MLRLLDGTRAYLHAVLDNFSRRILAWKVSDKFDPTITAELFLDASTGLFSATPTHLADSGIENFNRTLDKLFDSGILPRLPAMTEISYSHSLIESWWRSLEHQWLYLNTLDTVAAVRRLVTFYVEEHNARLPHSAFRGETLDELYFGTGSHIPDELAVKNEAARRARMEVNRARSCPVCEAIAC